MSGPISDAPLSREELAIVAALLDSASSVFGRHGCNDFEPVREAGCSPEFTKELHTPMAEWNGDPENAGSGLYHCDWYLMAYFAARIRTVRIAAEERQG